MGVKEYKLVQSRMKIKFVCFECEKPHSVEGIWVSTKNSGMVLVCEECHNNLYTKDQEDE